MQQCLHFLLHAFTPLSPGHVPEKRPMNTTLPGGIATLWHRPLWLGIAPRSRTTLQHLMAHQHHADETSEHDQLMPRSVRFSLAPAKSLMTVLSTAFVVLFLFLAETAQAQSGTAFRDFNGDGLQTGAEPGVEGIVVKLYGNAAAPLTDQLIGTTVTASDGTYNFAASVTSGRAAIAGEKLRVEFEIPVSHECNLANPVDYTSVAGAVYGSSVQFITGQQSNINFAINYPGQWVETNNPDVFLPCYFFGDNVNGNNDIKNAAGLVQYKFLDNGVPTGHSNSTGANPPTVLSTYAEVGALYGVAFSRQAQKIFTSAVMRRHTAFGPLGSGGIYMVDPYAGGSPTVNFLDLDAIGIATRGVGAYPANPGNNTSPVSTVIGTNTERNLNLTAFTPSTDLAAGDQVGKVSIGDIDISDDGRYLYVVNLLDRRLYEIDLGDPLNPSAPTLGNVATRVRSWPIPDPGVDAKAGEHRPWGLKFYRGKLFVGLVLSGQDAAGEVVSDITANGNGAQLRGYVFEFSPSGAGTFNTTPLLDFSFNYGRERPWIPWGYSTNPAHPSRHFTGDQREVAEPIIADIEFDDSGSMLIGLLDRKGHQYAINNNDFNGVTRDYEYSTAGELLRANVTETNGNCIYSIVTRSGTADYYNDNLIHSESVQGPLAVLPGGGDAIAVWLDPIHIRSGGTIRLNNTTGAQVPGSAYEVTDDRFTTDAGIDLDATPSKANGLGDVELSGSVAPLEIGNLVWADKDGDGVQDGDERGIAGVTVQLLFNNAVIGTTVTSATGNYYFNDANVAGDLAPGTIYTVRIPATQYNNGGVNGTPLQRMVLTSSNVGGVGLPNYSDNDAVLNAGVAEILVTLADFGQNDHTFDFGFIPVDYGDLPAPYHTSVADNGPSHRMGSVLKLGASVDYDSNGIPNATATGDDTEADDANDYDAGDDENGVTLPMFIRNKPEDLVIPVMNMTGTPAKLVGFFDWNGDGDFGDANEMYSITVADAATSVTLDDVTPPPGAVLNRPIGIRFRISTDATFNTAMSPDGPLPDGEVEDYVATVMAFDYGDLNDALANTSGNPGAPTTPADHRTLTSDNGPRHKLTTNANGDQVILKIGASVDDELDGQPSVDAGKTTGGDNNNSIPAGGANDEDGIDPGTVPLFTLTQTTNLIVPVMNMTGQDAKLTAYIDFNKNGDFGAGEMFFVTVPDGATSATLVIPVPISAVVGQDLGIRLRLNDADEPMSPYGPAQSGEIEDHTIQVVGFDYGDLPNTYGTTDPNGPKHIVTESLKLGTCSDSEINAAVDPMAGLMGGGDDGTAGLAVFGTCTNGDDEDGIRFLTPMVPGNQACIEVTAMNTSAGAAVLQMWVDWNGNTIFDANEAVSFQNGGGIIPNAGMSTQTFCFTVPADATFAAGNAFVRFRLSPTGGLEPNTQTAPVPFGEIEDYKLPLGKLGNLVWEDYDFDGQQDAGEPGIANVPVTLTWAGLDGNLATTNDNQVYSTTTIANGTYYFCGLLSDETYKITVIAPADMTPTRANQGGNDVIDSDGAITGMDLTMVMETVNLGNVTTLPTGENGLQDSPNSLNGFPDNQFDQTHDFGFGSLDYGDLPEDKSYNTTMAEGGAIHAITPDLRLGATVDRERDGQPDANAGKNGGGDGADEDGIKFITPLVPGFTACIEATTTNTTGGNAYLQGWIDFDGDGILEVGEQLALSNGGLVPAGTQTTQYCFTVPSTALYDRGMAFIRFRLSSTGGLGVDGPDKFNPASPMPIGEVEDYKLNLAKVGNIVWFDRDADGIQDESEKDYGINGVMVSLIWGGANGVQTTDPANLVGDDRLYTTQTATLDKFGNPVVGAPGPDDKRGEYYFCGLIEGDYKIIAMNPTNMVTTTANQGLEDDRDSDGDQSQIAGANKSVETFTIEDVLDNPIGEDGIEDQELIDGFSTNVVKNFPDNQVDQTIDFGFISRDFGDLPEMLQGEMFPTTIANNGASHTVPDPNLTPEIPLIYLGPGVDTDVDGQPAAMANGDDNNGTDDENGIRVLSPMVPGSESCVEVISNVPAGTTAYLQGWIDWNGNGKFDANEQVTTDRALVSGNGVVTKVCFNVPADATFNEGMAFMRWRISTIRGLGFTSQAPDGEVEDYKVNLAKIGNLVWNDENFNGRQDAGEEGIAGQPVNVLWAGEDGDITTTADNKTYPTVTDANGEYYVCGLIPGNYKIIVPTPEDMTPTRANVAGNTVDVIDSDGSITGMDLTMVMETLTIVDVTNLPTGENGLEDTPNVVGTFPDNQTDQTHDFGFAGLDYGDLPQEPQGEHFNTTMAENGPVHVLVDELVLGKCADAERDGTPDDDAGVFDGKDGDQGVGDDGRTSKFDVGEDCADDEDGIRFITPLVPGFDACIEVTYTAPAGGAVLQAWIDFNGNGLLEAGEQVNFVGGGALAAGTNQVVNLCFTVPTDAVFNDGTAFVRVRLSPTGGLTADGPAKFDETTIVPQGEVEDYMVKLAKVGNLVWEDRNWNGQQDDLEEDLGINGVTVALVYAGANGTIETPLTNASFPLTPVGDDRIYYDVTSNYTYKDASTKPGFYYFCGLIEGTYDVVVLGPKDLTPTRPNLVTNSQDEDKDSDGLETARNLTTQRTLSHSGTFTIDNQKEICELPEGEEGIGDQDLANLLDVNNVGTFPDDQVDQRFDFGFVALDFGDLPQETDRTGVKYNTTIAENGPRHIVKPDFFLGMVADAELDGNPDDEAGSKAYGNDQGDDATDTDPNSWKQGMGNDDGDGIRFMTPLIPGYEACIEIKYALPDNFNGPDGYLNAWIDYNGNGTLDAGEKLAWTKLNGAAAPIEPNTGALELEKVYMTQGNGKVIVCFKVPADAKYFEGDMFARFRLSENPRLGPDGILAPEANYTEGRIPCGEVEDYYMPLSKVGNLVWEDRDYDGIQDINEPVIPNVPIKLEYAGPDGIFGTKDLEYIYHDTTDVNGRYYFCGLIGNLDPSGVAKPTYRLIVSDPEGMTATFNNPDPSDDACVKNNSNGDDLLIDDRITRDTFSIMDPMGMCTTEAHPNGINDQTTINDFPDGQYDETRDFGYVGFDYGDLPVAGTSYLTLRDSVSALFANKFGPRHAIQPKLYLGEGVDGELNGKPDADAGSKAGGDDDDPGKFKKGLTTDDESGVRLLSPMIPGELAYIKVTYTAQDTAANAGNPTATGYVNKDAYLRAFIDFNGDGDLNDASDLLTFTAAGTSQSNLADIVDTNNPLMPGGVNQMQVFAFRVPLDAVYRDGTAFMRYRLSWEANVGPDNNAYHTTTSPYVNTALAYPRGEVEDYAVPVAKVGNLAWFDHDVKGDQNENDYVDTLQLVLVWGGVDELSGKFDTVGYQSTMGSAGAVTDVLYNLSIAPHLTPTMPPAGNDTPGQIVRTNAQGRYSFQGLIPGNYYLIPLKYLQGDSASFVNAWPRHRVLTLKDNPGVNDQNDSDGMPGALIRVNDGNGREPEVCVTPQPKNEAGNSDAADATAMNAMKPTGHPFPDSLYNQTIDFGWVDEPNIEANLDIVGVNYPTSQICGNFNVIMHLCMKNPQEVPLDSLQAFLNLQNAYGDALYTATKPKVSIIDSSYVTSPAGVKVKKAMTAAIAALKVNSAYDGYTNTSLLVPTQEGSSFYMPGDSIVCVRIEFEIDPTKTNKYPWSSQASVTARAVGFNKQTGAKRPLTDYFVKSPRFGKSIIVGDLSDEIDDPMNMAGLNYPDGGDGIAFEGMVADRGFNGTYLAPFSAPNVTGRDKYLDENDKTIQNDECWLKTKWNSGVRDVNIRLDENCQALVTASMLVPGHEDICGFDKYPEGSYYRVIIIDKKTEKTLWSSAWRTPFNATEYLGRELVYEVKSVANHCNPLWGRLNFEDKSVPVVTCPPNTSKKYPSGTYTFVCTDVDSVFNVKKSWTDVNYAYFTGLATATDNCGTPVLDKVSDVLSIFADCNEQADHDYVYAQIARTFYFRDEFGNVGHCTQYIYFKRPTIVLPDCKIELPANLATGDNELKPIDMVNKYKLLESVPYYLNGAGKRIYLTGKDYCGFAMNYTDQSVFNIGECGRKIVRRWSIIDWCYGTGDDYPDYLIADGDCYANASWNNHIYTWDQIIVVGDASAPVVKVKDLDHDKYIGTGYANAPKADPHADNLAKNYDAGDVLEYSVGPMNCEAAFLFSKADFIVEEASKWNFSIVVLERKPVYDLDRLPTGEYEMKTPLGVKVTGDSDKGYSVTGLPMLKDSARAYFIQVTVANVCYGSTTILVPIRIVDRIAPVMVCDDKLVITRDNLGNAKVAAVDVNEGSSDNCGPILWMKVRRPVGDCEASFMRMPRFVDANGNGKIDAYDPNSTKPQDYIDENRNKVADELEYFRISTAGALMSPMLDSVPFFCCDPASVMVELWGQDWMGNRSFCWNNITIEDKTPPVCIAPWEVTIHCDDKNLAFIDSKTASARVFGDVIISSGNLCLSVDTTYTVVKNLKCGAGTIERIWTITKETGKGPVSVTCKQIIRILPVREYNICFPKDANFDCKTPIIDTVVTDELGCDILAVNVSDKRYDASNDECYKIFRTYTVIDWCAYTDVCGDPMTEGHVYVVDRANFDNYGKAPIYVLVRDANRDQNEEFYLSKDLIPKNTGDIQFTPPFCEASGEYYHSFMYTQIIKVYDSERPVVTGIRDTFCTSPTACVASVTKVVTIKDNCTDLVELERQMLMIAPFQTLDAGKMIMYATPRWSVKELGNGQFEITVSNVPEGLHDLVVVGRDECGNLSVATRIPFVVQDCKAPAPICINGLSTELMPDGNGGGMMAVWAKDFVASPIYDCNGQGPETKDGLKVITKYSINRVGETARPDQTGLTLNCNDAGKLILVELHAWDERGNHDFCVTFVEVQDNRGLCEPGNVNAGEISGLITTDDLEPVLGVGVDLSGGAQMAYSTSSNGGFTFSNLTKGSDFTVTAQMDKDHLNGVSTFDLVLLQKHILGTQLLNNPYRLIAADVNNSKSISTLDMIQIRKLILGIDTKFTSVPSWKFVDANYRFSATANPWADSFPEVVNVNDLAGKVKADFIAIKMGDVNGNASASGAIASEIRGAKDMILSTSEQSLKVGQTYEVPFRAKDLAQLQGFQFTLQVAEQAEMVGLDYGVMKAENFGLFQNEGILTTSFHSTAALADDAILFTLKLKANTASNLSEVLTINSRRTNIEAYNQHNDVMGVQLSFGNSSSHDQAALYQNTPNPFADATSIGFYLPSATRAVLTVRDVKGALIYKVEGNYTKGNNQVILKQEQLRASGVMYYTLETSDFTATKKLVLMNR